MKIKVLFVAPYAAMENLIEACSEEERDLDIQIKIGNLQEGVALAKMAETQGFDVIISRGGTAKLIGEAIDIPVIDLHVSGYDMLRVLTLANDFPRKKAIVGFSSITLGARAIIDLLEIPIDIYTISEEEETEPLLRKLKQDGYQLIMGDVVTFETASRLGLLGILIQSGREAILDAFKEAKTVSRWMMRSRLEIDRLKKILQATGSDFMVVSEKGEIVYEQWRNFNSRPITDFSFDTVNEDYENNMAEIEVMDRQGDKLKISKTKIICNKSYYFVCEFSKLIMNQDAENIKISVLSPPLIINQSHAMNTCLTTIDRCLNYDQFILIGKRGTERELVAQYIHYQKFHGKGLYASLKASELLALSIEHIDKEIRTIYIHGLNVLDDQLRDDLWFIVKELKERGHSIILSLSVEKQSLWGNKIYDDDIIRIHIPSLVERKEDLSELVSSFILYYNQTLGTSAIRMNEKGLDLLKEYDWPGNEKELKALIKDAVLKEKGYVINEKLMESLLTRQGLETDHISSDLLNGTLEDIEKKIIEKVLEEEEFNQTKAAKRLNINRSTLWRKLKK